ncbi:GNAT family N-acetyltransferase [Herbiconiux daphne]|uniref:GNAT family N-acetyltransferase n=1 Tax=Herbiconiux daphne TaxID=2970914 RepID=A0ABT2H8L2_9MICO|nr:GNAT family N-acetyltransferase [Herbiconiux daphne]MCS5736289.1 GNAT family N-acetyltransferase [Herbiconiux daphne]
MPGVGGVRIRRLDPTRASDRAAVLDICVKTGDAGADATGLHADPRVLTDRWAAPYVDLEPAWAWLATLPAPPVGAAPSTAAVPGDTAAEASAVVDDEIVVGYVIGTPDTESFAARFAAWPSSLSEAERARHAELLRAPGLHDYPAHLHIDILPIAQARGVGRQLVQTFLDALVAAGVPGVHLGVDPRNTAALAFYPRLGFTQLPSPHAPLFTRPL